MRSLLAFWMGGAGGSDSGAAGSLILGSINLLPALAGALVVATGLDGGVQARTLLNGETSAQPALAGAVSADERYTE